jgi:hypothetical protein
MKTKIIVLLLMIAAPLLLMGQDQTCADPMSSPTDSIKFLEREQGLRQSHCIAKVIKNLGRIRDPNAVRILISYLDFLDPETLPRMDHPVTVRPDYPAIDALFQIGKPASNELLSAVQYSTSSTIRQNAAKTFTFVYRDDLTGGIVLAKTEELNAKSADARQRLDELARMLMDDCSHGTEQEAQSCRDAVRDN